MTTNLGVAIVALRIIVGEAKWRLAGKGDQQQSLEEILLQARDALNLLDAAPCERCWATPCPGYQRKCYPLDHASEDCKCFPPQPTPDEVAMERADWLNKEAKENPR